MTTIERYEGVLGWFAGKMPVAESELKYNDPFDRRKYTSKIDFQHILVILNRPSLFILQRIIFQAAR